MITPWTISPFVGVSPRADELRANAELDRSFRLLRQHGMSVPDTVRHASSTVITEQYSTVGFNYRLPALQAALGCAQAEGRAQP